MVRDWRTNRRHRLSPLTRRGLAARAGTLDDLVLSDDLRELWDEAVAASRRLAVEMTSLARFWVDPDAPGSDPGEADEADLRVALALRVTEHVAHRRIRQAHVVVTELPQLHVRLAAGELPVPWMSRVLQRTRDLTPAQRVDVDAEVASWDLAITAEQFTRQLGLIVAQARSRGPLAAEQTPEARRRVEVTPVDEEGLACLRVLGPVPEIRSLAIRLDAAARAVQAAQRHALSAPEGPGIEGCDAALPFDDGSVATSGRAMSLARLRYEIATRSVLQTGGVEVPAARFRIGVTIPSTTLLGAGDEPGLLDGTVPIPAAMARSLAGGESTWYRVLTDPVTGAYLPARQERYQPTSAMLEHLRHRQGTCAVPGCARPVSWASECDHIEEYDHADPAAGGRTEVENLHLLCWQHHLAKTLGRLDPSRLPTADRARGVTRWELGAGTSVDVPDDTDLWSARIAVELEHHWRLHEQLERRRRHEEPGREEQRREERGREEQRPGEPGGRQDDRGAVDPPADGRELPIAPPDEPLCAPHLHRPRDVHHGEGSSEGADSRPIELPKGRHGDPPFPGHSQGNDAARPDDDLGPPPF
ncbi:HNH endonuclease [Brachybacterium huguangmaarense]|uniref:HNH endonuclease n=1 Tax=Brachybacterium huguangmaarense TaxID=1652028 RepID=A0ABY6FYI3_9MICO|nr:HNH endonuclease signature motif containing protein [Brachybacterium huguangmaarense]UYG15997.1 HNH endonuclease [Brachybacterium huguangmaarense]